MTLRGKSILIIAVTFAALILGLHVATRLILLRGYAAIEEKRTRENAHRARNILLIEIETISSLLHDWSAWDETYEFVADPGGSLDYIRSNLVDQTFSNQKLNLILYADTEGRVVHAKAFDLERSAEVPFDILLEGCDPDEIDLLLRNPDPMAAIAGILLTSKGPMLAASRPIIDSPEKAPPRGRLLMGRLLGPGTVERLRKITELPIEVVRLDDRGLPPDYGDALAALDRKDGSAVLTLGDRTIAGYALVPCITGRHGVILRVIRPREIYLQGRATTTSFIVALLVCGGVVVVSMSVLFQRQIVSRMSSLNLALAKIGSGGDLSARVPVTGRDEVAEIAMGVNGMLSSLERTQHLLREGEERYRGIVENSRDVIMLTRPDGIIDYVSPAARHVFGYEPAELIGREPAIVHPEDDAMAREARGRAVRGEGGSGIEYRVVTKTGATRWVSHSWSPLRVGGELRMVVSIVRDITDRRRMEEDLVRTQKLESVGLLAGGIAHDFNNILTGLWGYLSLAREAARDDERASELIRAAEEAAGRAGELTQRLLAFSKGGAPLARPVRLGRVIRDAAGLATSGSSARCELAVRDDLWPAMADEGQIAQVVGNLVINAVQAMPQGGVIRIEAGNIPAGDERPAGLAPGNYVMIAVADRGIGIPAEHIPKIFDPYFTTKQTGSGLGLPICYSIARNHGGAVTVESTLGEGSTFRVFLPAVPEASVPEEEKEEAAHRGEGRILIMDDDDDVRAVAGRILLHLGYEPAFARDGEEMLRLYREALASGEPFRAVILDLTVSGGMGGEEAMRRLAGIDPRARAIVSSGYATDPIIMNYAHFGFSGFVEKPYRIEEMAAELERVLAG
ncbi:MAG: CHASE4 domain-containing protein [bacterium]|nr:CHASE4 domain-containing protein [bacterium]